MEFLKTEIDGVYILKPKVFEDNRGYFFESFSKREFDRVIPGVEFVQDNQSKSSRNVMRGLHFQAPPFSQAKLVRCVSGRVLDIAVDIRRSSKTYGRYVAVELNEHNKLQFFIPQGMAHGFAVLSENATFQYKCDNYYAPESEGGISILDGTLGISWPFSLSEAVLSEKDKHYPMFNDFITPFE